MGESLDPKHTEVRDVLRVIGPIIAVVGVLFIVIAFMSFFSSFGSKEPPRYFWCGFVGIPLTFVGIVISKFAYIGAVTRYIAGEVAPVGKDVTNYMVAGTKDSIRDVATAVGEGFAAASVTSSATHVRCHKCNAENDATANFCDDCGAPLAKSTKCAKCGELNAPDARFCDNCGAAVA